MKLRSTKRVSADSLKIAHKAIIGLQSLTDYAPSNPAYTLEVGLEIEARVEQLQAEYVRASQTLETVRDNLAAAENDLYDFSLGLKRQIVAQYGEDSPNVQMFGLKRKSEYRRPSRRPSIVESSQ